MKAKSFKPEEYFVEKEPYYEPIGKEIEVFEAAYNNQLP
ncbi:MAG: AAA family ATPase, partial [Proteobacteria bacterium]|nr:AAA family ATPase [Pseudomonadota bacterium]